MRGFDDGGSLQKSTLTSLCAAWAALDSVCCACSGRVDGGAYRRNSLACHPAFGQRQAPGFLPPQPLIVQPLAFFPQWAARPSVRYMLCNNPDCLTTPPAVPLAAPMVAQPMIAPIAGIVCYDPFCPGARGGVCTKAAGLRAAF